MQFSEIEEDAVGFYIAHEESEIAGVFVVDVVDVADDQEVFAVIVKGEVVCEESVAACAESCSGSVGDVAFWAFDGLGGLLGGNERFAAFGAESFSGGVLRAAAQAYRWVLWGMGAGHGLPRFVRVPDTVDNGQS